MSDSIDMTLGKLLATCTQIDEKISRLIWRVDDLEKRVEMMEQDRSREAPVRAWVERLFLMAATAGATLLVGLKVPF